MNYAVPKPATQVVEPSRFRTDINGLRAWAVVAVVLYHFGVSGFGGGFVGVDVFFVITGWPKTRRRLRPCLRCRTCGWHAMILWRRGRQKAQRSQGNGPETTWAWDGKLEAAITSEMVRQFLFIQPFLDICNIKY